MSPEVLRRKLQKKAKRKRWRRCSECGGHAESRVEPNGYGYVIKKCFDCKLKEKQYWLGGETGRRIH